MPRLLRWEDRMPDPTPRTHTFLFTDIEGSTRRWGCRRESIHAVASAYSDTFSRRGRSDNSSYN